MRTVSENSREYPVTKEHFKHFLNCVMNYVEQFGLQEYRVTVIHKNLEDPSVRSDVGCESEGMSALIRLNSVWGCGDKPSKQKLDKTAFHEVCHILFHKLSEMTSTRILTPDMVTSAEHAIIRRLESVMGHSEWTL